MNPDSIVGMLGWAGWLVGIVSGTMQIQHWRRERRIGPAKEKLFEEALRERKGQYTEEQINDLTELMRKLEKSTKEDIPRQARRVFIEGQLDAISQTLASNVDQHKELSRELARITDEHRELPDELAAAVESTIVSPYVEARRRQRRVMLLATVGALLVIFPGLVEYVVVDLIAVVFNFDDFSIGASNIIAYAIGIIVATCLMFAAFGPKFSRFVCTHLAGSLAMVLLFLLAWFVCTSIVYRSITNPDYKIESETAVATLSVLLLSIVIRIIVPILALVSRTLSLPASVSDEENR